MRRSDIEYWTVAVADRVCAGQPHEDARVELKAAWPENPWRAARRIAGHANAAASDYILWIIGLHETEGVVGAQQQDLATWWASVARVFEGLAPRVTDINVPYEGHTLVALVFETDAVPFVVKTQQPNAVQYEVPWREGTAVRSATRTDLIRLLVPRQRVPDLDVLKGVLRVLRDKEGFIQWQADLSLYVRPKNEGRIVIPRHDCRVWIENPTTRQSLDLEIVVMMPPHKRGFNPRGLPRPTSASAIDSTSGELIITGPGKADLVAKTTVEVDALEHAEAMTVHAKLLPVHASGPVRVDMWVRAIAIDPGVSGGVQARKGGPDPVNIMAKWTLDTQLPGGLPQ